MTQVVKADDGIPEPWLTIIWLCIIVLAVLSLVLDWVLSKKRKGG